MPSNPDDSDSIQWRHLPCQNDVELIRNMVSSTGFFRPDEISIAVELVSERLEKGNESGYNFVFAEIDGRMVGYTCYGPTPCTVATYDLYWIVVSPNCQGQGVGQRLMAETEQLVRQLGGRQIVVDTGGKPQYEPTRSFYLRCQYEVIATLPDFYDFGDDKIIFRKLLSV